MLFERHHLSPSLAQNIELVFYYKDFQPQHSIERVVPTGHVFIIFELDGMERKTFDNETLVPNGRYSRAWVSGTHKEYLSISAHQNSEMLVVQFKPGGAFEYCHFPLEELNNRVVAAEEVFGEAVLEVHRQISGDTGFLKKFQIVENWLLSRKQEANGTKKEVLKVLESLQLNPMQEHGKIVADYPKTQKHLISQFKKYVGLTPKTIHRIFRFNEILQSIQNKEDLDWSEIAYQFEYSDQSHFIKEFKEFSGFNPQDFIKRDYHKRAVNFFPLDQEPG